MRVVSHVIQGVVGKIARSEGVTISGSGKIVLEIDFSIVEANIVHTVLSVKFAYLRTFDVIYQLILRLLVLPKVGHGARVGGVSRKSCLHKRVGRGMDNPIGSPAGANCSNRGHSKRSKEGLQCVLPVILGTKKS